jgi:hypothetical protein
MTTVAEGGTLTALDLLFGPESDAAGSLADGIVALGGDQSLGRALGHLPQTTRDTAVQEAAAAAVALLKVDLIGVLVRGWREHRDIVSAARRTLAAPGSTELVSMITHQISLDQQPSVSVFLDGQRVATVQLGLSVVFDVNALLLLISGGRLAAVRSGRSDIIAILAVQGTELFAGRAHLELPGVVELRRGIALLPAGQYPADEDPPDAYTRSDPKGAGYTDGGHQGSGHPPRDVPPAPWWQSTGSVRPPSYAAGPH